MTSKDEALKMAYDWLNEYAPTEIVEACKKALEQPAQEPIHNCPNCNSLFTKEIYLIPAPSWQGLSLPDIEALYKQSDSISLYAFTQDVRAIEQALKEKNGKV